MSLSLPQPANERDDASNWSGVRFTGMKREFQQKFHYLVRLVIIPIVAGVIAAAIVAIFIVLLDRVIAATPHLIPRAPFVLPVIGALLVGALILRWIPGAGGEGIPAYINAVNRENGRMSLAATVLKFPATILTLGFHGSGGIVGPLGHMGAGASSFLVSRLCRPLKLHIEDNVRIAAICGLSGAISSIFHSPLGGGLFAAEILRKDSMRYSDLFPSIVAGGAAFVTSAMVLNQDPVFSINAPVASLTDHMLLWFPIVAIVSGAFGMFFIISFEKVARGLYKITTGQPTRALIGGVLVSVVFLLKGDWALNTSMPLYGHIVSGDVSPIAPPVFLGKGVIAFFVLIMVVKILATSCTVGSGMSGGFTGPLLILGIASGAFMSSLAGIATGTPASYGFMACALSAVLGAAMNIPIAAIVITTDLFGLSYIAPAIIGGILSFLLYKSRTVYEYATTSWFTDSIRTDNP